MKIQIQTCHIIIFLKVRFEAKMRETLCLIHQILNDLQNHQNDLNY